MFLVGCDKIILMKLSIIIPAYNEEKRLPKTLQEIDAYLKRQDYSYEIIVVNDGSKDSTAKIVEDLKLQIANLKLIDNKENHGKGWVVRQGMLEAHGDLRVFMDADNSTSIDQIEKMWPEFENGFHVVIGSRDVKGAVIAVKQSWYRQLLGEIFNLIVQTMAGLWGVWDTQCGFKGFTKEATEMIFPKCRIDRWAFDVEILVIAKKSGFKIKEIPVRWINDAQSKVKIMGMVKMLWEVAQVRWNIMRGKY